MWSSIKDMGLVVNALVLLASGARADCLDGHLEYDHSISSQLYAQTGTWYCDDYFSSDVDSLGGIECDNICCGQTSCDPCQGPQADFNVTASPNGYTITLHAAVPGNGSYYENTYGSICVHPRVEGGEMICTVQGASKQLDNGSLTVTPILADPDEPSQSYCLYCAAYGWNVPGSVDCSLNVSCTPTVTSGWRLWNNPSGGSYQDSNNWDSDEGGYCAPVHNAQRSDTALFSLASATHIPVSASGLATAEDWLIYNSPIEFSGSAQVFSTGSVPRTPDLRGGTPPPADSLRILQGGQLRLVSGASLDSVHAAIGASGATDSRLEVQGGTWTNSATAKIGRGSIDVLDGGTVTTGALTIGSGNGPGTVQVTGDASSLDVSGELVVGDTTAGALEVDRGLFLATSITAYPLIGKSASGTVTVRGDDSTFSSYGRLQVNRGLTVGEGANGRLNVQRGGYVVVAEDLLVNGYGANPAGEVVVDGQGGISTLDVQGMTFVNATQLQEIVVQSGGRFSTNQLNIGSGVQVGGGTADVTVRDRSGSFPTLSVGTPSGGGAGTHVGTSVPGQLNIGVGAIADLYGGLYVGEAAQGIVMVTEQNAAPGTYTSLTVNGETQVGIGAPGILHIDDDASVMTNGNMRIGLGGGNPSGTVNVYAGSNLDVNGTLAVGDAGVGLLNIVAEPNTFPSHVFCDTLIVGGSAFGATGIIVASYVPNAQVNPGFSHLTVNGNAQVGVGAGRGEVLLADPSGKLEINGTMTVGNPSGGPGGGAVVLVDAQILGTGNIVVNPNGSLTGTGTVSVPKVSAGGIISPGLSPGMLTIDGELEMLPGGKLIIEYAGLNPGEFDELIVTGPATFGGRLEVHFRNGFSPSDPTAFIHSQSFVAADQGVSGDYAERIYAYPEAFADFDNDADKDLSDVAAFQNCFGLFGGELEPACGRADWEDDGVIAGREIKELLERLTGPF